MSLKPKRPKEDYQDHGKMSLGELEAKLFPTFKSDAEYEAWRQLKIQKGLDDYAAGRVHTHEEVMKRARDIIKEWQTNH